MAEKSSFHAYNYVLVSPTLATSGVVPAEAFSTICDVGYRTVINLLPDDNKYAVQDEVSIVRDLGMKYVHIPIDIEAPTQDDYERFEAAMQATSGSPVWVHCAANWRVSAFVGLFAQLHLGWSRERAKSHVAAIWEPTAPWTELMEQVLLSRDRRLPLEGAWNFRDLGGYSAGDQRVRWRRLYRSSRLSELSDADCERLGTLDITLVCDLRRAPGRAEAPSRLDFGEPVVLHAPATTRAADEFDVLFASGERRLDVYRRVLTEGYRQLARDNCNRWSEVVRALIEAPEGAAIIHCTAGQDRTGIMIAIVLLALGVDEQTVIDDYCLTARFGPPQAEFEAMIVEAVAKGSEPVGAEALRKILEPTSGLLLASFEAMREDHGSIEGYLRESLGLDKSDITELKTRLLE